MLILIICAKNFEKNHKSYKKYFCNSLNIRKFLIYSNVNLTHDMVMLFEFFLCQIDS